MLDEYSNRLLMNNTKTEFLLIDTKQQLAKVNVDHLKVGNNDTVSMSLLRILGCGSIPIYQCQII